MEGSAALFQGDMTYRTIIDGDIGGEKFQVIGDGVSKYPHGDFNIHAVCTTGTLPFSWKVMCHVLQYGFPMFANYPNGLTHFTRECFPEGFTIDRTVKFEGDGTMTSHHTYELDGSNIISRVTLTMDGFDPDGSVMKNELIDITTTEAHMFPWDKNSVRQICIMGFTRPNDENILLGHFNSKWTFNGSRKIKLPNPHFVTSTNRQMKDDSEKRDHIVQREIATARPAPNVTSMI